MVPTLSIASPLPISYESVFCNIFRTFVFRTKGIIVTSCSPDRPDHHRPLMHSDAAASRLPSYVTQSTTSVINVGGDVIIEWCFVFLFADDDGESGVDDQQQKQYNTINYEQLERRMTPGGSIMFTCRIGLADQARQSIQWYHDNKPISIAVRTHIQAVVGWGHRVARNSSCVNSRKSTSKKYQ